MTTYYLYQFTCRVTGKSYIGLTNDAGRRKRQLAKGDAPSPLLAGDILKYGGDAFDFRVLRTFEDFDRARKAEQRAIKKFGTVHPNGYNQRIGGSSVYSYTPEARAKISAANRARMAAMSSEERSALSRTGGKANAEAHKKARGAGGKA